MTNKKTSFRQNLSLVLISITVAALLGEILLRIVLPDPVVWKFPQESYQFDPEIGHRLKSGQHAYTHDKPVATNSMGLRDIEYPAAVPDGRIRILALGDSQTFGNGLNQSDTWPGQLENLLNRNAGYERYEVLNSGLPATDTWQHEIILERMIEHYRPDVVILAFYVNDVVNRPDVIRPYQDSGQNPVKARFVYLVKQSALLLTLREAYDAVRHMMSPGERSHLQEALLRGESNPAIDRRWEQVDQSLGKMGRLTESGEAGFMVASLPRRDQVAGRLPADRYNQRLKAILDRHNIPFINMLGPLQSAFKVYGKSLFIPWDGHNSKIANEIVAGEIAFAVPGLLNGGQ